jgi:HSP20 family protein
MIMSLPTVRDAAVRHPFNGLNNDFDRMVDRLFTTGDVFGEAGRLNAVDVREDVDHLYVEAELPGYKKDEIDITLEKGVLTVMAERKAETEQTQEKAGTEWLLRERRYAKFARSFKLPPTVDESAIDAKVEDGVLKLTLNKRPESKPRKITVS